MEILTVENLSFTYPLCTAKALDGLSLTIEKGDFVTVCGATGCGKSTFLRMLKRELTPLGEKSGTVSYLGTPLEDLDDTTSACRIGYVMQRPEQQIVTDKVWHELAFGLENMGIASEVIRRRVAEIACYFGIEDWFERQVSELSGGQKQLLNLAAVMVMQPDVLLLDEPTAQLDPIAASDFISTISKLHRDLALTVVLVEHRLEEVIPVSDKILALRDGRCAAYGEVRSVIPRLMNDPAMLEGMPTAVRLSADFPEFDDCPLTVREGRLYLEQHCSNEIRALPLPSYQPASAEALSFSDVFFRYSRTLPDVLRGLTFTVYEREIFCILGGNGSGKSTTLAAAAALRKPYAGTIRVFGKKLKEYTNQSLYRGCLTLLPQDVQTVFLCNTVREELEEVKADLSALPYDLTPLLDRHPYDLSGGQQQLVALAKILASKPRLLLLDEPTKGLDAHTKAGFVRILRALREQGVTIAAVTHDVDFASAVADRCAMFFRGEIVSCAPPRVFFAGNSFYTTASNRMTRGFYDNAATTEDIGDLIRANREAAT